MDGAAPTGLDQLYQRFLRFAEDDFRDHAAIAREVLAHPASQMRLRSAIGALLKRGAFRPDLRADVMQEATLILIARFQNRQARFRDEGLDAFGGWLWT